MRIYTWVLQIFLYSHFSNTTPKLSQNCPSIRVSTWRKFIHNWVKFLLQIPFDHVKIQTNVAQMRISCVRKDICFMKILTQKRKEKISKIYLSTKSSLAFCSQVCLCVWKYGRNYCWWKMNKEELNRYLQCIGMKVQLQLQKISCTRFLLWHAAESIVMIYIHVREWFICVGQN